MLIPTHSIIAEGKGGIIAVAQNIQDLHYGTWLLGIDSFAIVNPGPIDSVIKVTSSLVHKNIGCFFGEVESLEPLQLFSFYNTSPTRKTSKVNTNFDKLFSINNIGHSITFHFDSVAGDNLSPESTLILHFSLYKTK
jgi:hypothetical protein